MAEAAHPETGDIGATAVRDKSKGRRQLITPEGVDLRLQLASGSERMGALFIDLFFMALFLSSLTLGAVLFMRALGSTAGQEVMAVIWLLGSFFLRVFYFPYFELGAKAATPGKRIVGIRVAPRRGGRLDATAILARNATRELELFLPLTFLLASSTSWQESVDAWIVLAGAIWTLIFAFFPLFNRDRLRPGDILGSTWVIKTPRRELEADLAAQGEDSLSAYHFTIEQLDAYGVRELHVLEDILRADNPNTVHEAAKRIRNKIRYPAADGEIDREFLNAYYTALRQRLESRLLYGVRRRDKHDRR